MGNQKSIKGKVAKIAQKFGLSLVMQFGSSLEKDGIKHSESDIDIAFLPVNKDFALKQLIDLQYDLAVVFNVFEDKIDLVDLSKANSLLACQIALKGVPLYDSDGHRFNRFYIKALKQKIDEEDILQLKREILNQRVGAR